jgi:hypothetical protein
LSDPIRDRSDQISFLTEDITTTRDHAVSVTHLAMISDVKRRGLERNLSHGPEEPGMPRGNPGLDDGFESALFASGLELFHTGKSMTHRELLHIVQQYHDFRLTKG